MLLVYSIVKSTHLYSLAGNFLIWQVPTPCRPKVEAGPAGLLGALEERRCLSRTAGMFCKCLLRVTCLTQHLVHGWSGAT
jgi:hypothetical protein